MVPDGWDLKSVDDLFEVQLGKMLNKTAKEKDPQFYYLGNSNVKWGCFDLTDLKQMYFSEREQQKFTLKPGDIVLCEGGEVGRCAIWRKAQSKIFYQKALHRLRSKGEIIPEYFQSFMVKIAGTKALDDFTTRTSIAHLTREKLLRLPVKLPPLPEQTKIAQILSTWDKAIATVEKLIGNSKQQKKALMQQLLTGKKRFGVGDGWKSYRLDEIVDKSKYSFTGGPFGSNLKSEDYTEKGVRIIQLQNIGDGEFLNKYKIYTSVEKADQLISCNIYPGDIIMSKMGDPVARATIIPLIESRYLMASDGIRLKVDESRFDVSFVCELLNYSDFRRRAIRRSTGSTRQRIGLTDLRKLELFIPELGEQNRIAKALIACNSQINIYEGQRDNLEKEKKSLMQQLLTGKRRVKVDVSQPAEVKT